MMIPIPRRPFPLLFALPLSLAIAHAGVGSFFDTDSSGWTAAGDAAAGVEYLPTGGNPGGCVRVKDDAVGGVWYFIAGSQYLGNHADTYGQMLRFDLRQVIVGGANQFASEDVILESGAVRLVYDLPTKPPTNGAWANFSIQLSEAAAWKVGSLAGPQATQAQIQAVLANVTGFRIRGEYQTGEDTGYLDNVILGSPVTPGDATLQISFQPVLRLQGTIGSVYRIDYSTSMAPDTWQELTTVRLTTSPYDVVDPVPTSVQSRFYRAVLLPP
ncbi:laminin B domain-containing protein [Luteolibacter luteus]|uniref:Laminin IV type A domain-containing protein n=1 Tax=Luteolibacter luteus TaxID=2728835 RepID=A0A858RS19_9BACT|nr:laminin B domain-containing protein [Luteolibacter luteus]QJE98940.1 hypothetical protein HHL09_25225 [Luteolibacter luteus]